MADGKLDISNHLMQLVDRVRYELSCLDPIDEAMSEEDEPDKILTSAMTEMEILEKGQKVSVEGKGVFITLDEDFNLLDIHPISRGLCIEGTLTDFQLQPIPTEKWIDILYSLGEDQSIKSTDIEYEHEGVAMFIDNVVLFDKLDNSRYAPESGVNVFIPLGYENTKVYKINEVEI